jgi:hypothetical protein
MARRRAHGGQFSLATVRRSMAWNFLRRRMGGLLGHRMAAIAGAVPRGEMVGRQGRARSHGRETGLGRAAALGRETGLGRAAALGRETRLGHAAALGRETGLG